MATINVDEFKSNSIKSDTKDNDRKNRPKIKPVVSGNVKTRKKSLTSRISEVFVREDRVNVKDHLIFDVVIPAIKDTIVDLVTDGIHMIFYGETRRKSGNVARTGSKISYSSYYKDNDDRDRRRNSRPSRNEVTDMDDILFETRAEAQEVLNSLADIIDEYGSASIADFYDLCGVTEQYTDHKYGWTDVSKATIQSVRGGYFVVDLPRARQIG